MTLIALALIRQDLEAKKRDREQLELEEDDGKAKRPDIHESVADVASAIAPFLLPLVDSLSQITGTAEPLSRSQARPRNTRQYAFPWGDLDLG